MGQVPGIVYRRIAMHLIKKAGFSRKSARTGAVTLIQRFGSALNLNIHFHMPFLDGLYIDHSNGTTRFCRVKAPTGAELAQLTHSLASRIGRFLARQGLLERDAESHAGVAAKAHERKKLERLCRYISRKTSRIFRMGNLCCAT